jgi:hypothetical protein
MNIFRVSECPISSAEMLCDKHIVKMRVESVQMLVSGLLSQGVDPQRMPLTSKGRPHRGGYHNHPCTVWTGECDIHFDWLLSHLASMCAEYKYRYGDKPQVCEKQLLVISELRSELGEWGFPDLQPQCMPDEFKVQDDPVKAYRRYYRGGKHYMNAGRGPLWRKSRNAPTWF